MNLKKLKQKSLPAFHARYKKQVSEIHAKNYNLSEVFALLKLNQLRVSAK